ncbi:alcohol dehydrogenase catalytic domain-containing protein [Pontiellaceae bacterium B1224]|nr:alcohol dehydrogenase catalytic domain-containing protein [Pontiellaceae bacterium B1224]
MKAMVLNSYGADSVFEETEVAKPEAKAGEVLVKIAASSVNTVDTMIRNMGEELPLSPATPALLGMDFAGTVEAVGEGVEGYAIGDEVYGCAGGLKPLLDETHYSLEEVDRAYARLESGQAIGKVVVEN